MKMPKVVILMGNSRAWERGLISGIAQYSRLHGRWDFLKKPVFFMARHNTDFYKKIVQFNPDGIIMRELQDTEKILKMKKPTVISPVYKRSFPRVVNIIEDCEATGRMAAEHLLSKGLKSFAYCGIDGMFWSQDRCNGFIKRIQKAGFEVSIYVPPKVTKKSFENELPFLKQWLSKLPIPTGLMCCIDERAEQVIEICKVEGIHIPEHIAIIGVDNDEIICDLSSPPLTSIFFDAKGIGYKAAELLDRLMKGERPDNMSLITEPAYIVQRQSTDLLAVDNPDVALAIRYIRQNVNNKIFVEDVAHAVAIPRRTLERHFLNEVGNTIYKEIQNERVQKIETLLTQTGMPISKIAYSLGFSCPNELTRFYCRYRKITPTMYRQKTKGTIQ